MSKAAKGAGTEFRAIGWSDRRRQRGRRLRRPVGDRGRLGTHAEVTPQPILPPSPEITTFDILVETLIAWGARLVFGIVGDGINPIVQRCANARIVSAISACATEEAAAFMASGIAKHGGKLGVCLGTTGPGAVHLMKRPLRRATRRRAGPRDHRSDLPRSDWHPVPVGFTRALGRNSTGPWSRAGHEQSEIESHLKAAVKGAKKLGQAQPF